MVPGHRLVCLDVGDGGVEGDLCHVALDETLNLGQRVFVLVVFGLELKQLLSPFWTVLRRQLPLYLNETDRSGRQQFTKRTTGGTRL